MNIERVSLTQLQIPLKSRFETSFGGVELKNFLLVSVEGGGKTGFGESVAMPYPIYNEETTETVKYMLKEFLIPIVKNSAIQHPKELLKAFSGIRRNNMAKSAIEGAVWDLYAKQKNISLAQALGGTKTEVEVGVSIGIESSVDELLRKVDQFLTDGYKKIKVKIKPDWDIVPIKAIRDHFGDQVPLMADANSAYTLKDLDILKQLDEFNLMMIEQPLAHDDIVDQAILQSQLVTPVCLDESIHTLEDARKALQLGSCKIINIKIGRVGGLTEAIRIHDYCSEQGIPVWCGGMLEAGVGRAHNLAITSLSNFVIPGDTSPSNRYWSEDIVEPEISFSKPGMITVPSGPGIGYEVMEERVRKYAVNEEEFVIA
ncbi:o-succinylbenzoate synthase [Fictibacillus fluitans]|uniref:o-succinylbenzoate synthase n=1 Tax=Fictibacillus fluitans TaxID=3058422 RepID=A0ABT8HTF2_9BACL|nr:o-succinylbenzoate synthase [Fictibacillus sp. NE201]MDN4524036.1 o-succinylbenzoate synthase [Fictibacillus sp. NE201]